MTKWEAHKVTHIPLLTLEIKILLGYSPLAFQYRPMADLSLLNCIDQFRDPPSPHTYLCRVITFAECAHSVDQYDQQCRNSKFQSKSMPAKLQ